MNHMKVYPTIRNMRAAREALGHPAALDESIVATGIDALFALLDGYTVEFEDRGIVQLVPYVKGGHADE